MRYGISYMAFVAASLFVATAQAQTPPGIDASTYILENSSGNPVSVFGHVNADGTPKSGYSWVQSTFNSEASIQGISPLSSNPNVGSTTIVGGTYAAGDYVVDSTGKLVSNPGGCTAAQGCVFVTPSVVDNKNLGGVPPFDYVANSGQKGFTSPTGDSTTSYSGGATYANKNNGTSTAIGPNGLAYSDGKGGSITLGGANTNAGGNVSTLTYPNAAVAVNGGAWVNNGLAVTGGANITGGTTTDTLTVTNGASVSGGLAVTGGVTADTVTATTVNAGTANVTTVNAGTVNAGTANISGNATVGGGLTVQGPTQLNGGVSVAPGQTINFGDNVVSGVATPIAPTDAANKAYVDTGLNNLMNSEKADYKKLNSGVAAAMALASPDRTGNQTGAFAVSESFWDGHSATGIAAIQQLYNAGAWDFSVGAAVAVADTGNVGGRVTGQFAWGGGYSPLK